MYAYIDVLCMLLAPSTLNTICCNAHIAICFARNYLLIFKYNSNIRNQVLCHSSLEMFMFSSVWFHFYPSSHFISIHSKFTHIHFFFHSFFPFFIIYFDLQCFYHLIFFCFVLLLFSFASVLCTEPVRMVFGLISLALAQSTTNSNKSTKKVRKVQIKFAKKSFRNANFGWCVRFRLN